MRESIASVNVTGDVVSHRPPSRGTGFLVGEKLVLTALHVVASRQHNDDPEAFPREIELKFSNGKTIEASVVPGMWSREDDWALLTCAEAPGVPSMPCSEHPVEIGSSFSTYGFPTAEPRGKHFTGNVVAVDATYEGASVFDLYCDQLAAGEGARAEGLSGGPCVVEGAVIGIVRAGPKDQDGRVALGTVYVTPMASILKRAGPLLSSLDPCRGLPPIDFPAGLPEEPYPGLTPYTPAQTATFFGRCKDITQLHGKLTRSDGRGIVLLYGASGVGKSSLLEAGVLPRLRARHAVQVERRDTGDELRRCLDDALARASKPQDGEPAAPRPVLVVIDQVEEVFARSRAEANVEMKAFVDLLVEHFKPGRPPRFRLLLSFRKEWYADIAARLRDRSLPFEDHHLEPLDEEGIEEIVHGLTRTWHLRNRYGRRVAAGLGKRIASELLPRDRDSPVAPTLALVMYELWKHTRPGDELTAEAFDALRRDWTVLGEFIHRNVGDLRRESLGEYVDSGLVEDVLLAHTTQARYALPVATTCAARDLQEAYPQLAASGKLEALLEALKGAHLLTSESEGATRLSHDTLAPLVFARWQQSEAPGPRARRLLEWWTREWQRDPQERRVIDAAALAEVEKGLDGMRVLTPDEAQLLEASRAAREAGELERKRRERRERFQRRALGTLGVLVVVSLAVALWYNLDAKEHAEKLRVRSLEDTAQILASRGGENLQTAALLAVELLQRNWTPEADAAARSILGQMALPVRVTEYDGGTLDYIKPLADGDLLLTAIRNEQGVSEVSITDLARGAEVDRFEIPIGKEPLTGINVSSDGGFVAVKSNTYYWRRDLRAHVTEPRKVIPTSGPVIFSKNNRWMASKCADGVCVYDPQSEEPWVSIPADDVDFRADTMDTKWSSRHEDLLIHKIPEGVAFFDVAARSYAAPSLLTRNIGASDYVLLGDDLLATYPALGDASWSLWQIEKEAWRPVEVPLNTRRPTLSSADGRLFVSTAWAGTVQLHEMSGDGRIKTKPQIAIGHEYWPMAISREQPFIVAKHRQDLRVFSMGKGAAHGRVLHDVLNVAPSRSFFTTADASRMVTWAFPGHGSDSLYRSFDSRQLWESNSPWMLSTVGGIIPLPSAPAELNLWMPERQNETLWLRVSGKLGANDSIIGAHTSTIGFVISRNGEVVVVADEKRAAAFKLPNGERLWSLELPLLSLKQSRLDEGDEWVVVPSREARETLFGFKDRTEEIRTFDSKASMTDKHLPPNFFVRRRLHIRVKGEDEGLPKDASVSLPWRAKIAVSPQGDKVAIAAGDKVWVYDTHSGARKAYFSIGMAIDTLFMEGFYTSAVDEMMFDDSGQRLGVVTHQGILWQWTESGSEPVPLKRLATPDGVVIRGHKHFFVLYRDKFIVKTWNGDDVATFGAVGGNPLTSKDDARIATSKYGVHPSAGDKPTNSIVVWDIKTGAAEYTFPVENDAIGILSWDGQRLAIHHAKGDIDVWDISTYPAREVARIPSKEHTWSRFGFVNRDLLWTIASEFEGVHLHPLGQDKLIDEICRRSIRNMTAEQWARFFGDTKPSPTCKLRSGKN
ncbi:serine protease [Polyangium sp. 15x6]|uniref:serine protease n=1 Tax=Polyangium sp. 15x6 TaxID=3042687 RepID=UPI00249B67B8|nr:serine protease [Polyangium sp. 15x6]MDI3283500.1 serine protease [Polyangium sp. 15x6]